ncbi:MAG: hypothetical protein ACHWZW_09905 [Spirulina sp.]
MALNDFIFRSKKNQPTSDSRVRVITTPSLISSRNQFEEADHLFMQKPDGVVQVIGIKDPQASSVSERTVSQRNLYSEALAKYIVEQEQRGNKFFVQKSDGSIKRFSVQGTVSSSVINATKK